MIRNSIISNQLITITGSSDPEVDAYIMELRAKLYTRSSELIKSSKLSQEQIAKQIGSSRSRINRIANLGENYVSIELLQLAENLFSPLHFFDPLLIKSSQYLSKISGHAIMAKNY